MQDATTSLPSLQENAKRPHMGGCSKWKAIHAKRGKTTQICYSNHESAKPVMYATSPYECNTEYKKKMINLQASAATTNNTPKRKTNCLTTVYND
jgi:hypothetical protein